MYVCVYMCVSDVTQTNSEMFATHTKHIGRDTNTHTDRAEDADGQNRPDHLPITKYGLSCMHTEQVGDDTKGRQGDDVDLGMAEKPEQVLKQHRAAAGIVTLLPHGNDGRHEEAGTE